MAPLVDSRTFTGSQSELGTTYEDRDPQFSDAAQNQLRVVWTSEEVLVGNPRSEIRVDPYNPNKGRLTCFLGEWMFRHMLIYCTCAREIKANIRAFLDNRNNPFMIPEGWEIDESDIQYYDRQFSPRRVKRQLVRDSSASTICPDFSLYFFCFRDLPIKRRPAVQLSETLRASL